MQFGMTSKLLVLALVVAVLGGAAFGISALRSPAPKLSEEDRAALYAVPLKAPVRPLRVYHLGHSLVGRDMPAMLAQLMGADAAYDSQLGWGTSLREHWEPDLPINGFDEENAHPRYRSATEALGAGEYTHFVLTEMVEIRDAIKYHQSDVYLHKWAEQARAANPSIRIYVYETWHGTDTADGWLSRLDADLARHWQDEILFPAIARDPEKTPIHVIPAGQVLAAFVRKIEKQGGLGDVSDRTALFARMPDGTHDPIHLNDLGNYLVALVHYAVLTHQSPVGLPFELRRADGTNAASPGPDVARLMQNTVWDVVRAYPETGLAPPDGS